MNRETKTIQDVLGPARMSRKKFLKVSATTVAAVGMSAVATGCPVIPPIPGEGDPDAGPVEGDGPRGRGLTFESLDDALFELDLIEANPPVQMQQEWSLYKVLHHIAQSTEYSMTGYPKVQPAFIQTFAKLVFNGYKRKGFMQHNLGAPVPDAPEIPTDGPLPEAFARLRAAIAAFKSHTGELQPHFAYGDLSREDWELAHSFHCADHFSSLTYEIA
jgi:hypothetical protein